MNFKAIWRKIHLSEEITLSLHCKRRFPLELSFKKLGHGLFLEAERFIMQNWKERRNSICTFSLGTAKLSGEVQWSLVVLVFLLKM
jgi:hypothetical protein